METVNEKRTLIHISLTSGLLVCRVILLFAILSQVVHTSSLSGKRIDKQDTRHQRQSTTTDVFVSRSRVHTQISALTVVETTKRPGPSGRSCQTDKITCHVLFLQITPELRDLLMQKNHDRNIFYPDPMGKIVPTMNVYLHPFTVRVPDELVSLSCQSVICQFKPSMQNRQFLTKLGCTEHHTTHRSRIYILLRTRYVH